MWGLAPFQQLTEEEPGLLRVLPLMPEWYLAVMTLGVLSMLGLTWRPLLIAAPLLLLAVALPMAHAIVSASKARFSTRPSRLNGALMRTMVAFLHLVQPLARLRGRLRHGLTIWRQRGVPAVALPIARTFPLVVTRYRLPQDWLRHLQVTMKDMGGVVLHGGDYDNWDLDVRGGIFGSSRLLMAFEDTGSGTQLVRVRAWPCCQWTVRLLFVLLVMGTIAAGVRGALATATGLALLTMFVGWRIAEDSAITMGMIREGLANIGLLRQR
jgi:hypothetical protein